jgi:hypothetical protein
MKPAGATSLFGRGFHRLNEIVPYRLGERVFETYIGGLEEAKGTMYLASGRRSGFGIELTF